MAELKSCLASGFYEVISETVEFNKKGLLINTVIKPKPAPKLVFISTPLSGVFKSDK